MEYEQVLNSGENRALSFAALPTDEKAPPPVIPSINGVWTGRGPFDVIVEVLPPHALRKLIEL